MNLRLYHKLLYFFFFPVMLAVNLLITLAS